MEFSKVNRFADLGPAECLHDELFYKNGYDVPLPHFLQEVNRAAHLGTAVSALPLRDLVDEHLLQGERLYAVARRAARKAAGPNGYAEKVSCLVGSEPSCSQTCFRNRRDAYQTTVQLGHETSGLEPDIKH